MALLFLFFDGIGVGRDDPAENPFAAIGARRLGALAGRPDPEASFGTLDATLGVPGLPQSATGQTTLLTGVNAAAHAGRHMVGIPGPTLRPLLSSALPLSCQETVSETSQRVAVLSALAYPLWRSGRVNHERDSFVRRRGLAPLRTPAYRP